MSDEKPRITSFAFSKEIFGDSAFSSFLFDNKDIMNLDLDKRSETRSPQLNAKPSQTQNLGQYQYPSQGKPSTLDINYSKENKSYPLSATIYNTNDTNYNNMNTTMSPISKSYNAKYGMTTNSYHLNSTVSTPVENYSLYKQPINEHAETTNYYNIINAIKRENINTINNTSKSLHSANSSYSSNTTPPLSPLPVNINNQKFYKGASQQSYSAVDLSRPDSYDDIKGSKSVKDYSMNSHSLYNKPRSKSIHNINTNIQNQNSTPTPYEEDSIDYLNDSITDYSFTQKDYEGSVTTNGSEKEKKGHSRSLSKSLKRAVSRNSKKSKKGHRKNHSTSEKSLKGYNDSVHSDPMKQYENNNPYQEFNESALVFKPSSGAIASYGEIANNDSNFDFDSMISSDQTRKISLTPNRMNEIQKHNSPINRLKPKNHERENFVPMTVINNTLGRTDNYNIEDFDYDSDDSIDRLLNEGKPKKKQETLWEFLKNSDPDDFLGNGKAKQVGKKVPQPVNVNTGNDNQVKYIPIKIQYSPFDNENNNIAATHNTNNQNLNNIPLQNVPYMKPINENISPINAGLPIQQRSTSKNVKHQGVPTPPPHYRSSQSQPSLTPNNIQHQSGMKLAQTISNLAKTPELSPSEEEPQTPSTPLTPQAPQIQEKQYKTLEKPKPKMVTVGTQWYISDAPLMRKKKVMFRPVDRRNPIAKYMFNHAFIETIYVTNESFKKKRNIPNIVPSDFLARNFYYYSRNPSAVPTIPKVDVGVDPIEVFEEWSYPERDANPIAKYMYLVKEGDYPWRDCNPIAKYIFKGYEEKDSSSTVIMNCGEIIVPNKENEIADEEIEIINDVLIETTSSCGSEKEIEESELDKTVEVIKAYGDESDSINNEDTTEVNDDITLSNNNIKKQEIEKELHTLYTQKEKEEIVNKLFNKIIFYLEDKEEKQKENNKTQEFAKLMFDENTKLRKELSKIRSELSAERVLRERAEEELDRYQSLMQSTLLK